MENEERLHYLLTYHDQLTREFTATCFSMEDGNAEYSSYLKETLHEVNDQIKAILLQPESMPF